MFQLINDSVGVLHMLSDAKKSTKLNYMTCLQSTTILLQEGGPLPGPKSGLFSNTQKWTVGDIDADNVRDFIGKGCPGSSHVTQW